MDHTARLPLPTITIAATATTTTATATATTTATATAVTGARSGFVDMQRTFIVFVAVGRFDRLAAILIGGHGDEREPARLAGFTIGNDGDLIDLAMLLEQLPKALLVRTII